MVILIKILYSIEEWSDANLSILVIVKCYINLDNVPLIASEDTNLILVCSSHFY